MSYIDRFLRNKYRVIVFDRNKAHPSGFTFHCVSKEYTGDFGNDQDIELIFEENKIDKVFHFLNSTVPATSADIHFDVESNLLATISFIQIMQKYHVKDIVFISSSGAIYGNHIGVKHAENEDSFPISSYGIVKLAIEKYIHLFSKRNNLSYLILRLSNPYGPYHNSTKQGIINIAINKSINRDVLTVWGDGSNKKDYIFVGDFIQILMRLIDKNVSNEIINIGSGYSYSINEILNKVKLIESSFIWKYNDKKEFDNMSFELNTQKLKSYINNFNFTSLNDGIEKTFDWYKNIY